jgi:hypothetical protein
MFFHEVAEPVKMPTKCALCGSTRGPLFEIAGLEHLECVTAHGLQAFTGQIYVCIGTQENTGCVLQMADRLGCLLPEPAALLRREHRQLSIDNTQLRDRVRELEARELRVVSVEDLKRSELREVDVGAAG